MIITEYPQDTKFRRTIINIIKELKGNTDKQLKELVMEYTNVQLNEI